jgi:hypothetical protein
LVGDPTTVIVDELYEGLLHTQWDQLASYLADRP